MLSLLIGNGLLVKENYNAMAMYFNSFHRLSVTCVQKWRRKKYWQVLVLWQTLILFVLDFQIWKRILYSIRKRSVGSEDQRVNWKTLIKANSTLSNAEAVTLHVVQL